MRKKRVEADRAKQSGDGAGESWRAEVGSGGKGGGVAERGREQTGVIASF